ncbi:MAG: hypothetical protein NC416_08130 [Eubacterium sp.]|nr:hypothetical protein [Eubacterium sp.]
MGGKRARDTLEEFNRQNRRDGVTYAEAQRRETLGEIEKIRKPHDGTVYKKASEWNALKKR